MSKWDKMGSENFRTREAENTPVKIGMVGRVSRTEQSDFESSFLWIYQIHNTYFDRCEWQAHMIYLFCQQQTFVVC